MNSFDKLLITLRMIFKKDNGNRATLTAKEIGSDLEPALVARVMKMIGWLELFTKEGQQLYATAVGAGYRSTLDETLVDIAALEAPGVLPKKPRRVSKPRPFTQLRRDKLLKNMETMDPKVLLNAAPFNAVTYLTDYYQHARHSQDVGRFLRGVYFLELRELLAGQLLEIDKRLLGQYVEAAYDAPQWTKWHQRLLPLLVDYITPAKFDEYQKKLTKITHKQPLDEKMKQYQEIQESYQEIVVDQMAPINEEVVSFIPGHFAEQLLKEFATEEASDLPQLDEAPQPEVLTTAAEAVSDPATVFRQKSLAQKAEIQVIYDSDPEAIAATMPRPSQLYRPEADQEPLTESPENDSSRVEFSLEPAVDDPAEELVSQPTRGNRQTRRNAPTLKSQKKNLIGVSLSMKPKKKNRKKKRR